MVSNPQRFKANDGEIGGILVFGDGNVGYSVFIFDLFEGAVVLFDQVLIFSDYGH